MKSSNHVTTRVPRLGDQVDRPRRGGRRVLAPIALLALLTIAALPVTRAHAALHRPDEALQSLRRAESEYDRGMELLAGRPEEAKASFLASAAELEAVVASGVRNAGLQYNLGNALVRAGDLGGGILAYLRARDLAPADPSIAANLAHARTLVVGRPSTASDSSLVDRLASWWHVVPLRTRAAIAVGAWIALCLLVAWRASLVAPAADPGSRSRQAWIAAIVASLVVAVGLGGTVLADLVARDGSRRGVVLEGGVIARKGNGDGFEPQLASPLSAGVEFTAIERRPGWIAIRLADGSGGWVPERSVGFVSTDPTPGG